MYGNNAIYFDCSALNWDDGDCSPSTTDTDGDGFDSTVDCNDNDASIYPRYQRLQMTESTKIAMVPTLHLGLVGVRYR